MNEIIKKRLTLFIMLIIIIVFTILLIINETHLFDDKKTHSFDEAVDKQLGEGTLNMTEKNPKARYRNDKVTLQEIIKSNIQTSTK